MYSIRFAGLSLFGLALQLTAVAMARADVSEFYSGKQMRVVVGSDVGGGYDAYARLLAAHLGKHIPGKPNFIVQNMPGAGSLVAVNFVANVAPKDGTIIGAINPATVTAPLFRPDHAKFDPRKFNWLGSPVAVSFVAVVWHTAPVKDFDTLFQQELLVASSGGASSVLPLLTNGVLGTKFKVVHGYKSSREAMFALERGEAGGNGGQTLSNLKAIFGDHLKNEKLRVLVSYDLKPNAELPGIPRVMDYAKTQEQKDALNLVFSTHSIGWPYMRAGDVPGDRAAAVRKAFETIMQDSEFLAEADKRKLDILPVTGGEQAKLVEQIYRTPEKVVARVRDLVGE